MSPLTALTIDIGIPIPTGRAVGYTLVPLRGLVTVCASVLRVVQGRRVEHFAKDNHARVNLRHGNRDALLHRSCRYGVRRVDTLILRLGIPRAAP